MISNHLDNIYEELVNRLFKADRIGNTRELLNVQFKLTDINNAIISRTRNISLSYLLGELVWYFSGNDDLTFIEKFSSFWTNISDDGKICNSGYGAILYNRYGFNQVEKVISLLEKDVSSRRAIINFNVPNKNALITKDEICTMFLQFYIRDNKLNCTGSMRSNDIYFGLPYDIVFFTILQKYIADRLGLDYGYYIHNVVSLHLYDRDVNKLLTNRCINNTFSINHKLLISQAKELYDYIKTVNEPKEFIITEMKRRNILEGELKL